MFSPGRALVLLIAVASVGAATRSEGAEDAADKAGVARKLVAVTYTPETYKKMVDGMAAQLPPDLRADFAGIMMPYQELADLQTGLFVKYYSTAELQQLLKFYTSPLGKKTLEVMPEVMQDAQGVVMARVQAEMPKIVERYKKKKANGSGSPAPSEGAQTREPSAPAP